jgi:hypothetical protein
MSQGMINKTEQEFLVVKGFGHHGNPATLWDKNSVMLDITTLLCESAALYLESLIASLDLVVKTL